jgi:methyl-accepting chemotaxis protein
MIPRGKILIADDAAGSAVPFCFSGAAGSVFRVAPGRDSPAARATNRDKTMYKNMRLGTKLVGAFVAVAAITLVIGAIGYRSVLILDGHLDEVGDVQSPGIQQLLTMETAFESLRAAMDSLLNPSLSAEARKQEYAEIEEARARYRKAQETFERLPQDKEGAEFMKQLQSAREAWKKENEVFLQYAKDLDDTGILNPTQMWADLQQFRGDHYKLETQVAALIDRGKEFEGGSDPTQCNFGKWMATSQTKNPEVSRLLAEIKPHHNVFHASANKIREELGRGNKEGARELLYNEIAGFEALVRWQHPERA